MRKKGKLLICTVNAYKLTCVTSEYGVLEFGSTCIILLILRTQGA